MRLFQIDQRLEYPLSSLQTGPFAIRCTYARSRETREGNDVGQDYITYQATNDGILFCVCDGVSQSFYGNLAAKYLGDSLLKWMLQSDGFHSADSEAIQRKLSSNLQQLTAPATEMINRYEIPSHIGGLFREVLEEKRAKGSETTFVCGKITFAAGESKGRLTAAWLGDTMIRLLDHGNEISGGANGFSQWNRWSTSRGVMGEGPSVLTMDVARDSGGPNCVQIFTDGLRGFSQWKRSPSDTELRRLMETSYSHAASDDVSFLEIGWV